MSKKLFCFSWIAIALSMFVAVDTFAQSESRASSDETAKQTIPDEWMEHFEWRSIGPANMSGRITSIAVYEDDPRIWYVASASGGLLKTTNSGINFEHQFDDQATVSIGDVQVSQQDPNVVWVGTGESNPRNSVSWGDGVYKSTDGGKTWKNMGLKESFQIGRIAIHPENHDIVYVGTLGRLWGPGGERGLYKTTDGGENWERVHFVDENTGVIDVKMHPRDPDTLLVATYERMRDGFDGNDPVKKYGAGSGLYRTTDGGKSFRKVTDGLPACKLGRIGLDWYQKNPKYVYAIIESEKIATGPENMGYAGIRGEDADVGARLVDVVDDSPADECGLKEGDIVVRANGETVQSYQGFLDELRRHVEGDKIKLELSRDRETVEATLVLGKQRQRSRRNGRRPRGPDYLQGTLGGQAANKQGQQGGENEEEYGGVYMSKDGGVSWKRINTLNPRPMYYSQIRVDPSNKDNLYVLGTSLYRSSDGGETFTGDGGRGIHPDHHAMWIDPDQGDHMVLGNDGGVYVTYDRMDNWDHYNHIAIGQFYHVGIDHNRNYRVYGGLQDNGSWGGPAQTRSGGPVNSDWFRVGGGDGFITLVDPTDADQIYFESQNGAMGRIHLTTGDRGFIRPRPPRRSRIRYRFNWKTPFVLSPHNPRIHYSAGNYVFRSYSKGDGIKAISPDITNTDRGAGSAISESPVTAGVLYVGTTDGAVWMTRDGGENWEEIFVQRQEESSEEESPAGEAAASPSDASEAASERRRPRGQRPRRNRRQASDDKPASGSTSEEKTEAKEKSDAGLDQLVGNWEGEMHVDQLEEDQRWIKLEIAKGDDGKLKGKFTTPRSVTELSGFELDSESGELSFSGSNDRYSEVGFQCKLDVGEGQINGKIDIPGTFEVDFDCKKVDKELSVNESRSVFRLAGHRIASLQETADAITGVWTASMESEEMPGGRMEFTLELKMDDKGVVSGMLSSMMGEMDIYDGSFDAKSGKLRMEITSEENGISADVVATVKGENLTGTLSAGDGEFEADFAAKRTSRELPEGEEEVSDAKPQEEARERPRNRERAGNRRGRRARNEASTQESTPAAETTAADDDPVTGKWEGQYISDAQFMRGDRAKITLMLTLDKDKKVKGFIETMQGEAEITEGSFNAEKNTIEFMSDNSRFEIEYSGTVKNDKIRGDVDFGGRFSAEFEATRVSKTASASASSESEAEVASSGSGNRLGDLVPGPRWVSSIEASKHAAGRVYLTLDGHRSNDDEPYVFVSEDYGKTWSSIRANLPTAAGTTRVLREDYENENLLFLGCEFSAWVSIDRGKSWTRFAGGLPTVAVHEIAIHPTSGEIVAGTHGRSLWVADITGLRKLSSDAMKQSVTLLEPNSVVRWRQGNQRGSSGTRRFVGENPSSSAEIFYYIGEDIQNATLTIHDLKGDLVRTLEADSSVGLHKVDWDLRRESQGGNQGGGRRGRFGRGVPTGKYLVTLSAGGRELKQILEIQQDPDVGSAAVTEDEWELMQLLEGVGDDEGKAAGQDDFN